MEELVSIIIPTYNAEKYISKCLDSVLNQTYKNLEIIVVDDESIDSTSYILDKYLEKDSRIKVIHQQNRGVGVARKNGYIHSNGPRILFLDSDDWLDKKMVKVLSAKMDEDDADCVMCGYIREYESRSISNPLFEGSFSYDLEASEKKVHRKLIGPLNDELRTPHRVDNLSSFWGKLYKRACADKGVFVSERITGTSEDTIFNIYALEGSQISYVDECLYHYRKDNISSVTSRYKENLVTQWDELYKLIWKYIKSSPEHKTEYVQAFYNRIACCTIGLGLNEVSGNRSIYSKLKSIQKMLKKPLYQKSYRKMQLMECPVIWKLFFALSRMRFSVTVTGMLLLINVLRGKE